ncbi:MAG: SMP-30/gluconolactonase/LRE family protein [Phycisphaerales bacterium]|nr:SMP-30/gluconolactonase/LRE family protein [Phycisphaerales bacterium]
MTRAGIALLLLASGCTAASRPFVPPPSVSTDRMQPLPADCTLDRPEDGVLLDDGSLIVADRHHGLRMLEADGSHRPWGELTAAGYDADRGAISNGVSLTPDRRHVVLTDVIGGSIWLVPLDTGKSALLHQHPYGVNAARMDSLGGVWFTQSTAVTFEGGHDRLLAPFSDATLTDGVLWHLAPGASQPTVVLDGLHLANGLALDEANGRIHVAEMIPNRVWHGDVDLEAGTADTWTASITPKHPDNLELDGVGGLWVTCPGDRTVGVIDLATGQWHTVLDVPASSACGLPTGMVLDAQGQLHAVTGLGEALVRVNR